MKGSLNDEGNNFLSGAIFNKEAVWKLTPLICTMVSGIRSRILEN